MACIGSVVLIEHVVFPDNTLDKFVQVKDSFACAFNPYVLLLLLPFGECTNWFSSCFSFKVGSGLIFRIL